MTIAVVSESQSEGAPRVHIFTKNHEASGETLGAAIDALHLTEESWSEEPYLVLRRFQPDDFFPQEKRARLTTLMAQWRAARDSNQALSPVLQTELDQLIEDEQEAMLERSQALLDATRK